MKHYISPTAEWYWIDGSIVTALSSQETDESTERPGIELPDDEF